jgi:DNA-binding MarR family transcriptional regulator
MSNPPRQVVHDSLDKLRRSVLADDLSFLLARASAAAIAAGNAALSQHGLRARSYSALAASDDRPTQRELSQFLRLDPSQIVALVDDLQDRGLVERVPDPLDRRANVVTATEQGLTVFAAAHEAARAAQVDGSSHLDLDDRLALADLLQRVALSAD